MPASGIFPADAILPPCEGPNQLTQLVPHYVRAERVEAWAPVRVKDAFEFHGQCNSTHSVRYALARNGGPVNRWRHAVNVHLMQARERKQSLKSVLDSKLSPRWPEATHLLYTYYTPYGHTNVRGGVDSFAGVVSFSLTGPGPRVPPYAPSWVRQAAMALRYEPVKRHAVGLWINNCGPRRAGLADLLLGSGLRVESYGRCRHNTSEGQAYWAKAGRLHEANVNPNLDESYPALRACRRHRLILAEENELCPGYYTWDLINAIKLCGAIPIIFTAGGLPDYGAEVGPFPSVNASRRGWLREVQRIMRDDAYYRAKLEHFKKGEHPPPPGAHFESSGDFHCQWHGLSALPRRRVQWPVCAECKGHMDPRSGDMVHPELADDDEARRVEAPIWKEIKAMGMLPDGDNYWNLPPHLAATCNLSQEFALGHSGTHALPLARSDRPKRLSTAEYKASSRVRRVL